MIDELKSNAGMWRLFKELPKRVENLKARLVQKLAQDVLAEVQAGLGSSSENYGDQLEMRRVRAPEPFYVIKAKPVRRELAALEPDRTVVYVRIPKGAEPNPIAEILRTYSPWPPDVLPATLPHRQARLVYRAVTKDEVQAVRRARESDRVKWRVELDKLGVRNVAVDRTVRAVDDIAFRALRQELGSKATKSDPVWIPALMNARRGLKRWFQSREVRDTLTNPSFSGWKGWPLPMTPVSSREIQRYRPFEKRLLKSLRK